MNENHMSSEDAIQMLAESYMRMAHYASDIAFARRSMYEAYISEGFTAQEALELCKFV
jgi:hypothetical protein